MDPRIDRLAKVMIHYSLKLKKGKLFKIVGELEALPLIKACYQEATQIGAYPYVQINIPDNDEFRFKHASDDQLDFVSPMATLEVNKIDAYLSIWGTSNTRRFSGVDPKRQARASRATRKIFEKFFKRTADGSLSWCGTQFPTLSDAQEADMSLSDYEDFVFGAGYLDKTDPVKEWQRIHKEQDRLVKLLNRIKRIEVKSANADLSMNVTGRKWINCAGTENFPDGEIFTSPLENSTNGFVKFSYPAVFYGRETDGVRLEFKAGKVVAESADKNLPFLTEMLNMDPGARRIGEFAIGTNYSIKRYTRNTLFDEKIGGTFHMAVGASIPEAGGKNKSSLHWDMVCDVRKDSEIRGDGQVIYRNGKFVI